MKYLRLATATAAAATLCASIALAETAPAAAPSTASPPTGAATTTAPTTGAATTPMKLSQSECTNLWQQAGGTQAGLTAVQAGPYVSDFKLANPDGDATIDQTEWMAACTKGMVKSASSSGASTGTSGSTTVNPQDNGPTKQMDKAVPQMAPPAK